MSTPSDALSPGGPGDGALTSVPFLGPVIGWLDSVLDDFGWPSALNQAIEFALLGGALYSAIYLFLRHAVPLLTRILEKPVNGLVNGLRMVFLLPDFAIARTAQLANARPPALLYSYGNAVLDTADHVQSAVHKGLPTLATVGRWSGRVTCALLVVVFLYWNTTHCTGQPDRNSCKSPTEQWVSSVKTMFDDQGDAKDKKHTTTKTKSKKGEKNK
ncbi:hypothetical protein ACGFZS_35965 [Streptomyces sp. NPDC048288]|uniref:hypothetical protein n=1 Tax=Streptomyces sp. NPDC048288 TaxID=3365529 RepID=UPI003712A131